MEGEIFTQFKRPDKAQFLEPKRTESKVEPQGSIPIKEQVTRFMASGALLQAYRRSAFDAVDEAGELTLEDFVPMIPDADPVEVKQVLDAARARLAKQAKEKAEADNKAKADKLEAERTAAKEALRAEIVAEIEAKRLKE